MNPYQLSPEEHELYYREIEQKYLPKSEPQENPRAIITGAQPGSGKSGLTDRAKDELRGQGGFALIDADKLRGYSPHLKQALQENDREAANLTHADAGKWASRFALVAAQHRRNLIIDQTSKDPAALSETASRLRSAGYGIELRVLAVNPLVSQQRIHMRYETQKANIGHGRFSTQENHDAAYAGLIKSVQAMEQGRGVDAISVYDKNHNKIFPPQEREGQGNALDGATEALRKERERPLSRQEWQELSDGYDKLSSMLEAPERAATADEKRVIAKLGEVAKNGLAAEIYRSADQAEVIKTHPELAGAYAAEEAIRKKVNADGLSPDQAAVAMTRARQNIASSIEAGRIPSVSIRKEQERDIDVQR